MSTDTLTDWPGTDHAVVSQGVDPEASASRIAC